MCNNREMGHPIPQVNTNERDADVNKATTNGGVTPLFIACFNGHTSVVEALLGRDADVGGIDTRPPPSGAPWACSLLHG